MSRPEAKEDAEKMPPIPLTITYLEMTRRPGLNRNHPDESRIALMRLEQPPVDFYRYLYHAVGEQWYWVDRKRLTDWQLAQLLEDDRVEISVLYAGGVPAGFVELDFRKPRQTNINYLGLVSRFIGRGLGRFLLNWAIEDAWNHAGVRRLTINTCTLDHPSALALYQSAGFVPYARKKSFLDPNV